MVDARGEELRVRLSRARTYWAARGVDLDAGTLAAYVEERIARVAESARALLKVDDLYLACACARGHPLAIAYVEHEHFPAARRALARMSLPGSLEEDVLATLCERLFVSSAGAPPLIASYSGRGELGRWLRSVAVNAALRASRDHDRWVPLETRGVEEIPVADAELAFLRGASVGAFQSALRDAFAALERRDRNLLRQYFLDGLTLEGLARLYGVHSSTVWRRIEASRKALVDGVRARLRTMLGLSESGVNSVVRSACEHASVAGLLRPTPAGAMPDLR